MTETEWEVIGDYVLWIAKMMGLRDWSYCVNRDPSQEGTAAQIRCVHGAKYATIWFAYDFRSKPMSDQKRIVAHELMHCHTAGMGFTTDMLKLMLHPDAWNVFQQSFEFQLEHCVEGVAGPFSQLLPDIPWPDGNPAEEMEPADK